MSTAWILLAGRLEAAPALAGLPKPDLVVAADGGARHAGPLGVAVDAWVGDFDSSQGLALSAPKQKHPTDKNQTDGELAALLALERGAKQLCFLGAFGGRSDHAFGNALLALRLCQSGVATCLCSGDEWGWPLLGGQSLSLRRPVSSTLSVLALSDLVGLSLSGVRWPLAGGNVPLGSTRTLSNEVGNQVGNEVGGAGEVHLALQEGHALVIACHEGSHGVA